jgi:hypothetical protein
METITTKYLGATEMYGERIKAQATCGITHTIQYPYELSGVDCHTKAVNALNKLYLNWHGEMVIGSTKEGYVYVFTAADTSSRITLEPTGDRFNDIEKDIEEEMVSEAPFG